MFLIKAVWPAKQVLVVAWVWAAEEVWDVERVYYEIRNMSKM
jgi:hypothetical protein